MRGHELQDKLTEVHGEKGTASDMVQALDPKTGRWYWVTGVQKAEFVDSDGTSSVTVLQLEGVGGGRGKAEEALERIESKIRNQASVAPVGSMEWRAHMADLAHVEAVRMELNA